MIKLVLIFLFSLFFTTQAFGQDVSIYLEQTEYDFLVGENVVIPAIINNTHGLPIIGQIQYTITTSVQQGSSSITNVNSATVPFQFNTGVETITLGFGSQPNPGTLNAQLLFNYIDTEPKVLEQNLVINIILDPSQKNNQQNPTQTTSQPSQQNQPQQQNEQSRDPFSQSVSSRLQNNQIPQDGQAIQEKYEEAVQENRQVEEQFQNELAKNEDFDQLHQELLDEGFQQTDSTINAESEDTGNFTVDYQNKDGELGSLEGRMEDGKITEIQKQTQSMQEELLNNLKSSERFQELDQQLLDEGFIETETQFQGKTDLGEQSLDDSSEQNNLSEQNSSEEQTSDIDESMNKSSLEQETRVSVQYENPETNATASITGVFDEEELKEVILDRSDSSFEFLWWMIPLLIIIGFIVYLIYRKYYIKNQKEMVLDEPFDYKVEARKLIIKAQYNFKEGNYKNAFSDGSSAIKLLLSYQLQLNKEITNKELLAQIDWRSPNFMKISEALGTASLIDFAKAKPTDTNFDMIVSVFEIIYKEKRPRKLL